MNRFPASLVICACLLAGFSAFGQMKPTNSGTAARMPALITPMQHPAPEPEAPVLQPGALAPDFVSRDASGKAVRISDFKGKVVILDFWATWCGPCQASMPHTQTLAKNFKDQGVVVLAVCTSDTRAKYEAWVNENQAKYPDMVITCDLNDRGSKTFNERASQRLFHVRGVPTQFIIGRDGKIAGTLVGYDDGDARAEAVLASCGVKVDPAVVAKGQEQVKHAAEEEARRAQNAKATAAHPRPPFFENFGRTAVATVVPGFDVVSSDGKAVTLSDYSKDKVMILVFCGAGGLPEDAIEYFGNVAKRYGDQSVAVVGLFTFTSREAFDAWVKANGSKCAITVVWDPAGAPAKQDKPSSSMNAEEKKAFRTLQYAVMARSINMRLLNNGGSTPMPAFLVTGRDGKLVGWAPGYGQMTPVAVGNLLLRAGIKLADADKPSRVYTYEETKAPAPEATVAMLKPGAVAPDFTAKEADGKDVRLFDYKGKVIILDFWATWCGPYQASMPHTQEVAAQYKDQGVVVFANCTSDDRTKFEKWVTDNQSKYPDMIFSYDEAGRKPERVSHRLYGVGGIPQQFVIGRDGKVAATVTGYLKGEVILESALAKAGVNVNPAIVAKGEQDLKNR